MKDLLPILKSLRQRKSVVFLLVLQISVTLTILINTAFVLAQKQQRDKAHQNDAAVVSILWAVIVIIGLATALGLFGQVRFSIITRRKQIGTRRALGANKMQVLRFFMLENLLICSIGIAIGIALTVITNMYLIDTLGLNSVPTSYLFFGALCMWLISQFATVLPVYQAIKVSPAIVTRSA